jgi:hypothetical protein
MRRVEPRRIAHCLTNCKSTEIQDVSRVINRQIFSGLSRFFLSCMEKNEHSFRTAKSTEIVQIAEFLIYLKIIFCRIQHLNAKPFCSVV